MKTVKIDSDALQEMCDSVDLLEYAQQTMDFKKMGEDTWFTHCPRHVDKTPSLAITPGKNLFHCFSCNCGGTILNWLISIEGLSFPDAIKKLSDLSGKDIGSLATCEAMAFYRELRDIFVQKDGESISHKRLNLKTDYYEKYSNEVPKEWLDEGISEQELKKYEIRVDKSSNRIVYPVYDSQFAFIGVKGRTRFQNYKELKLAKYMNYYPLGKVDYFAGMKQAKNDIENSHSIIITEGIKSVMKIDGWDFHNCVASETSALNVYQIEALIQLRLKNVTIAYDKDVKLEKIKKMSKDLKMFCNVFAVIDRKNLLDDKMSPCDKGREVWEKLYAERIKL